MAGAEAQRDAPAFPILSSHAWEGRRGIAQENDAQAASYGSYGSMKNGIPRQGKEDVSRLKEVPLTQSQPLRLHPSQQHPPLQESPTDAVAFHRAELQLACAAVRARCAERAAARKSELDEVWKQIAGFRSGVEELEEQCFGTSALGLALLRNLREEVCSLRAEAELLRKRNSFLTLRGVAEDPPPVDGGGSEQGQLDEIRDATRSEMETDMQELQQLLSSKAQAAASKRAALLTRCLNEVRTRLDAGRQRIAEVERDLGVLEPATQLCKQEMQQTESEREELHEELLRLQRTSAGMRAELTQLQTVRDAVLKAPENIAQKLQAKSPGRSNSVPRLRSCGGGVKLEKEATEQHIENYAALQRRLAAVAPQLMPLCTRARGEMEELLQSCSRLEMRVHRLEMVAPT
mmetsp:Transcript_4327/g.7372  ORF Transcript_4327/g.7372 Transcript_4327/m.7372 type:complete len:405 (-) Transcript_4327:81-1295(-)